MSHPVRPPTTHCDPRHLAGPARFGVALVVMVLVAIGAPLRRASACSMARCESTQISIAEMDRIPTNTPAFLIFERDWLYHAPRITSDAIVVESQAGVPVPFHLESVNYPNDPVGAWESLQAIVLDEHLEPQTWYYLRYPEYCPYYWQLDPPLRLSRVFYAGEFLFPAPEAPTVWHHSHQLESIYVGTSSGSCVTAIPADVVRFSISHPDAHYWNSLIRYETLVDGVRWAISELGEPDASGRLWAEYDPAFYQARHRPTVLFGRCGDRGSPYYVDDPGLELGSHHVEIRMLVHGFYYEYPSVEFDVELSCPEEAAEEVSGDLAIEDAVSNEVDEDVASGEVDEDLASTDAGAGDAEASSGCAASPRPGTGIAVTLLPMFAIWAALRRRST